MSDRPEPSPGTPERPTSETPAQRARRLRRLREVFGDVLPDQTGDDTDAETGSGADRGSSHDEWLRRQVPPHH